MSWAYGIGPSLQGIADTHDYCASSRGAQEDSPELPHRDFLFQLHLEMLEHAAADQLEQAEHVARGGAGLDDDIAGVAIVDLGAADLGADEPGLLDQARGAQAGRVLEHARR